MKNTVTCKQCGIENPFYQHICVSCSSFLRERVVNIDLWRVISLLIESPLKGFSQVIYSEHKNFIVLIVFLSAVKLFLDSIFIAVAFKTDNVLNNFFINFITFLVVFNIYLLIFSYLLKLSDKITGLTTRFKDHFAVLSYSLLPHVFGLVFLFVIELVLFGGYLFSYNPSPFLLKETLAYTLLVFELLVIAWSIFLTFMAAYTQSKHIVYSLLITLFFNLFLYLGLYFFSILFIK